MIALHALAPRYPEEQMNIRKRSIAGLAAVLSLAVLSVGSEDKSLGEWPAYGHDSGGQRFSPLTAINRQNVKSLKIAWTFRTGDAYEPKYGRPTAFEATPLYIDGKLYIGTPLGRVIALDPVTGKQIWAYDSKIPRDRGYGDFANRGVSTWQSGKAPRRIFIATIDAHLIALDAATGQPCADFGDNGIVNLRNGLRIAPHNYGDYEETSPPAIVGNTIILGSGVADNGSVNQASGEVRGFDAISGKLKWTFDPIPQDPKATGADTWKNGSAQRTGAANAWSVIAADPQRNLVFLPVGSASPDFYGGERLGNNLFANSLVALRADTGERVWYFQTVHHDLWDYDVASPPILFDVHKNGKTIPAVGVGSKTAHFFILNRETGEPIFGVEERSVPASDTPGEVASPTQPFPVAPHALSPQGKLTADNVWGSTEEDKKWCREEVGKLRSEGVFTPPSLHGTLLLPGNIGGMAWGGAAFDPTHHLVIIPTNNMATEVFLIPRADFMSERTAGRNFNGDWEFAPMLGTPYGMKRRTLRSPMGSFCNPPPWGMLNAVDSDTAEIKWTVPLGQFPPLGGAPGGPPEFGSIALGGPIVTAGGLIFMAGTLDPAIRAFDVTNGKELWKGDLPTSARATPMTFQGPNGKQYLVTVAGGHGIRGGPALGDYVVAFTLP
jgi:quinoprotein glucose dehydrogenase